jgi:Mce-associated membrane protein
VSENDETGKAVPEFVAVTPRGGDPVTNESVADEPEATAGTEPEAPASADEPAEAEAPASVDAQAEPERSEEPEAPAAPATGSTGPETTEVPPAEPAPASPAATVAAERPAVPSLDATGAAAPLTGPAARLPEPEREADGDFEVSVRVAAEGMAAALSGSAAAAGPEQDDERTRSGGPLAIATAVCVVLALAAGVLLAVTAHTNSHHRAVAAARTAALDAAKRDTAVALTYHYQSLDQDFARAAAGMSRRFRASYTHTTATEVRALALKNHTSVDATVAAAGVVTATSDQVKVLVFADQVVQNKLLNATSRLDQSTIEVTMVKENGRWVIDNLQPF